MFGQSRSNITLETVEIFNHNNGETLVWEGIGATLEATIPEGPVNVTVFVVRKISGPGNQPVVVRVVGDNEARVIDYILYPRTVKDSWFGAEHRTRCKAMLRPVSVVYAAGLFVSKLYLIYDYGTST